VVGRNTQGVTIIRLDKQEKVIGVDSIAGLAGVDDEEGEDDLEDLTPDENEVPDHVDNNEQEPGLEPGSELGEEI
jgi:DNA gyrase subunit A